MARRTESVSSSLAARDHGEWGRVLGYCRGGVCCVWAGEPGDRAILPGVRGPEEPEADRSAEERKTFTVLFCDLVGFTHRL
jgi:hypothetical protein